MTFPIPIDKPHKIRYNFLDDSEHTPAQKRDHYKRNEDYST